MMWIGNTCYLEEGEYALPITGRYIYPNLVEAWREGSCIHREDGPALIFPDGYKEWYSHGFLIKEEAP